MKYPRRLLLLEDAPDDAELLRRHLSTEWPSCEVVTVRGSRDVLEVAEKLRPSAIVLDLMMPDQDGWDLMQILMNQPETQTIPIIVCSVLRQRELALSLGATAFLEKPVSEERLLWVLNRVIVD